MTNDPDTTDSSSGTSDSNSPDSRSSGHVKQESTKIRPTALFSDREVWQFLLRGAAVYFLWYLLYELWISPNGQIEERVALILVDQTAWLLGLFGLETIQSGRVLGLTGTNGVEIINACTGIAENGLFMGFIFAYKGAAIRRLAILAGGTLLIHLANITRILLLVLLQAWAPELFHTLKEFVLNGVYYAVILTLWVIWVRYGQPATSRS